jgi:hypothetical protein
MKRALTLLAFVALAHSALAEEPIDRALASSLKSYDCNDLTSKAHELDGKIIKLKFFVRNNTISTEEDGSKRCYVSSFYYGNRRDKEGGSVYVKIPEDGLAWFTKVPTNWSEQRSTFIVIGRVENSKSGAWPTVALLGREIKTDIKGSKIVW